MERIRNTYDEIISEICSERKEAIKIARAYKTELVHLASNHKDIQHLHATVSRVLKIVHPLKKTTTKTKEKDERQKIIAQTQTYEQIKQFIRADTLKTMQLLRFHYKATIGEPFTQICANPISALGKKKTPSNNKHQQKG